MSLNRAEATPGKVIYAAIVVVFAFDFPLFLLGSTNANEIEINILTISLAIFYLLAVSGFVLLIFKIEGFRFKLQQLDNKTDGKVSKINKLFMKLVILSIIFNLVYLYFGLWK